MYTRYYDLLYSKLSDELETIMSTEDDPVNILKGALLEISKTLDVLRAKVLSIPFPSSDIEILFFKTIKPKFHATKIFHFELYGLQMNKPVGTKDTALAYYQQELGSISRFFMLHAAAYDYYRTARTELDHLYFLRAAEVTLPIVPEAAELDPLYATAMDYLFAKFIAYEQLQQEILKRIGQVDGSMIISSAASAKSGMKWTGKTVNLCELIYGLYYTGQLNNGNAQLSEIVALFERMFTVKIRDVHHTFGEIRERKVSSPSKFIDSMSAAIQDRVEEDLKYKPGNRL